MPHISVVEINIYKQFSCFFLFYVANSKYTFFELTYFANKKEKNSMRSRKHERKNKHITQSQDIGGYLKDNINTYPESVCKS